MRYRRGLGCLLVLLAMATGLTPYVVPPGAAQGSPDLAIHVYRDPGDADPMAPGNEITYQIYVTNWSMSPANDVLVRVTLPAPTTYVSSSGPGFVLIQAGPTQLIWTKNRLIDFERGWLSFAVRVDDDAPIGAAAETRAEIYCLDTEPNQDNNESTLLEYVLPAEPDLQVTKHLWPNSDPVVAGNEITYEIAVQNLGGTAASSVRLTDTLPVHCTYISDDPADSGFAPVQTGQTVVWTRTSLPPARDSADSERLYVHCRIANEWTPEQWLENAVETSTADAEYSYDNNLSRWVYKPEAERRYGAAITSLSDRTFRQASDAGLDYVVYYLDWSSTEPLDGEHNWANLDAAVWQAWRYNLRLVVRVDRAPAWARSAGTATAPPSNPAKLGELLQAMAGRWPRQTGNLDAAQIYGYVIWNEPNLAAEWGGNPPEATAYTALLQAAWNGVQAAAPDARVISAGLATTGDDLPAAMDDRTYLQAMYDAGAGSYFDYLGVNPLGFASAPDDTSDPSGYNFGRAEAWRAIMEANGDAAKQTWGLEAGWLRDTANDLGDDYNWIKVSEIDQAHYLARAYHKAACEWAWMGPMVTWNLDFAAGDSSAMDHAYWFGITDENHAPLRAYLSLQNAATRGPADLWLENELIDPVEAGQDVRYVLRYTNVGGRPASGVLLTDTLPAGTEYVGDTGSGVLLPGGDQVEWTLGDVDTCAYETMTLTLHVPADASLSGWFTNRVEANVVAGEPFTDDNAAEAAVYPTASALASFTAEAHDQAVHLAWETTNELDLRGFYVYRSEAPDGVQVRLNETLIPSEAPGNPTGATYKVVDDVVVPGVLYYYWLESVDVYGGLTRYGPVTAAVVDASLPHVYLPAVSK